MAIRRLILLPLLAGCSAGPSGLPSASLRDSLDASRASLRAIQGEGAAPARPMAAAPMPAVEAGVAAPAPPRLPGGQAPAAASALMQQPADAVRAALGEPSLRRAEGPLAEIWLYEAPRCRLDIILYREAGGPFRVAHAQARAAGVETQTEAECLRDIAGGRAAPPAFQPRA